MFFIPLVLISLRCLKNEAYPLVLIHACFVFVIKFSIKSNKSLDLFLNIIHNIDKNDVFVNKNQKNIKSNM